MKTLLMLLAAALLFVVVGCEEQTVEPIVAASPQRPAAPALQKLVISERLDVRTPEGFTGFVFEFSIGFEESHVAFFRAKLLAESALKCLEARNARNSHFGASVKSR